MKVDIGPAPNFTGPYQIARLLRFVGCDDDLCRDVADFLANTCLYNICQFIYDKRKKKVKVKVDKFDVWSADITLAYVILPVLKEVRKTKQGVPCSLSNEDLPAHLRFNEETFPYDEMVPAWGYIMDEMIWAFEQILDEEAEDQFYPEGGAFDKEGYEAHNARVIRGTTLFGKYFQNLWT